ncbi:MAG: hypothetical protein D6775_12350 [Caldilineae bacterium]|nr:MAG: hypothetical protein D6775_12350 [Caldilineae bacterium]
MSLFDRIRKALSSGPGTGRLGRVFYVRCNRCGEVLSTRVDLANDLTLDYESGHYFTRKVVVGSGANRCFQRIEIRLTFDNQKQLIDKEISGGTFVERPEANAEG